MSKIILNCEVSEILFKSIIELFPEIVLTSNGNVSINIDTENAETMESNDIGRLAVISLSKLSLKQKMINDVRNNNNDSCK